MKPWLRNLILIFSVIGPGIITSTVDNDASGIATYSVAGAQFGYTLLWTLIPITILLIVVQEMVARMGVVTGKGLADLIREEFGVKITMFVMVCLFFANLATTIAEFAGMAAAGELFGISRYIVIPICTAFILLSMVRARYRTIEKIFLTLIIFYALYVISGILAHPDWGKIAHDTVLPTISASPYYWFVLVAVVGTSVTPWMQFYLQSTIVEKGVRIEHLNITRWDIIIGSIVTGVVAFFIIIAAAISLHGSAVAEAKDVALALAPIAGKLATLVFAGGFFVAAFLGAWIVPLSTAYFITEGIGFESGMNRSLREAPQFYMLVGFTLLISAGVVMIPTIPLFPLILFAQVVNAFLLPIVILLVLLLINKKRIMKEHVNGMLMNIISIGILLMLLVMGGILIWTAV